MMNHNHNHNKAKASSIYGSNELLRISFEDDDGGQQEQNNMKNGELFSFGDMENSLDEIGTTKSKAQRMNGFMSKEIVQFRNADEHNNKNTSTEPISFVLALKQLLDKDRVLIDKLNEMIEQIEKHRKNLLIAKTTGVSVAGVGTGVLIGCVIAAPFTLGLSLVPATIFGGTCAVSGALTSAGSDIADAVITKKFEGVLRILQDERNRLAIELGKFTTNINCIVHKLVEWGYEKEVAVLEVFRCIKNDTINLASIENIEEEARVISSKIIGADKNLNATTTDCSLNSQADFKLVGGIMSASAGVGRIVVSVAPLDKVVSIFAQTSTLIGRSVLQGVGVVVGVAFTVVDIVSVVHNWRHDHPLIPHLKTIIEALTESEEEWVSMLKLLEDL